MVGASKNPLKIHTKNHSANSQHIPTVRWIIGQEILRFWEGKTDQMDFTDDSLVSPLNGNDSRLLAPYDAEGEDRIPLAPGMKSFMNRDAFYSQDGPLTLWDYSYILQMQDTDTIGMSPETDALFDLNREEMVNKLVTLNKLLNEELRERQDAAYQTQWIENIQSLAKITGGFYLLTPLLLDLLGLGGPPALNPNAGLGNDRPLFQGDQELYQYIQQNLTPLLMWLQANGYVILQQYRWF